MEKACYAVRAKDDKIRLTSSSGGVFSVLAQEILRKKGVVYGCAIVETEFGVEARHVRVENEKDLVRLRGSKYVESRCGGIFKKVQTDLNAGRDVLFSGTPCQALGLRKFLAADDQTHLIIVDFVCHGTPRADIFQKYCDELRSRIGRIADVAFRVKEPSWRNFAILLRGVGGQSYQCSQKLDPYMRAFMTNYSLRETCYMCRVKNGLSQADITLADGWSIHDSGLDDGRGLSAVFVNTVKGVVLWRQVGEFLKAKQISLEEATHGHTAYFKPPHRPKRHALFQKSLKNHSVLFAYTRAKYGWILGWIKYWLLKRRIKV